MLDVNLNTNIILKAWDRLPTADKSELLYQLYSSNRKNKYLYFIINDNDKVSFVVTTSEKKMVKEYKPKFYGILYEVEKGWQKNIIKDWEEILGIAPPKNLKDNYSIKQWAQNTAIQEGYKSLNSAIASWVANVLYDNFNKTVSNIIKDVMDILSEKIAKLKPNKQVQKLEM